MPIKKTIKGASKGVDALMSKMPWSVKNASYVKKQGDKDMKAIKLARAYDNSSSEKAVMARTSADFAKDRIRKRTAKIAKFSKKYK
jgi:hypothetical protein